MPMPVEVTRIEVVVIEPPKWEPPRFALETAGAERARMRCGAWPTSATIGEYLDAVRRAARELDWIEALEDRYWRRHGVPVGDNEVVAARLRSRRHVARELFEERRECLHRLTEPEAGSA